MTEFQIQQCRASATAALIHAQGEGERIANQVILLLLDTYAPEPETPPIPTNCCEPEAWELEFVLKRTMLNWITSQPDHPKSNRARRLAKKILSGLASQIYL